MKRLYFVVITWLLFFSAQIGFSQAADLSKAKAFYKGKTITWMIGSTPGGSVDRLSRLVGPYLAKHGFFESLPQELESILGKTRRTIERPSHFSNFKP